MENEKPEEAHNHHHHQMNLKLNKSKLCLHRRRHHHLLLLLLLLLITFSSSEAAVSSAINESKKQLVLDLQKLQWRQQKMAANPTSTCTFQKSRVEKGATILEMRERDDCLGKGMNWNKNLQKRLISDEIHVKSLQSRIKVNQVSESEMPLTSGTMLQTLNYIVTVGIGGRNMTLIVDTGSDLTWVQCQPCRLCYNQQEPLFNPSVSPSYLSVLCNSTTCFALASATGNSGVCGIGHGNGMSQSCNYVINYGDGSYSRGELGFEKLILGKTLVDNFVFGCGRDNKGLFGGVSGLMGLARSELSLVSQTSSLFGGIFSYCLPSTGVGSSGSLVMGNGDFSIFKNVSPISYTRMIPNPQMSNFYFLNVTGMSVGGVDLIVPSLVSSNGVVNLIDSGTVITRLPPSIYRALKTEFAKQFSGYQTAPPFSILNTCYNLSGYEEINIPTIKFYFEGNAELTVDVEGVFYFVKSDASQICLAFASLSYENEVGIIGNYQQKNQRVVYNSKESKVGFAGEPCSF